MEAFASFPSTRRTLIATWASFGANLAWPTPSWTPARGIATVKTHVLDAYALLAYFEGEPGSDLMRSLLYDASQGRVRLLLCLVNWGELYYIVTWGRGSASAEEVAHVIDELPVELVDVDRGLACEAARLKARGGMSYADCFAAALALREGGLSLPAIPSSRGSKTSCLSCGFRAPRCDQEVCLPDPRNDHCRAANAKGGNCHFSHARARRGGKYM